MSQNPPFRVGVTPDFAVEARGRYETAVAEKLDPALGVEWELMPPQPGGVATPDALERYDAIFCLKLRIGADSLRGVSRTAVVARWGVGYDQIDVAALTAADVALAITPAAVRRPVAEAILTFIFALAKNLREQDQVTRDGRWRADLSRLGMCLGGRTLGSVGCGNIGREMFRLARSLGFARFLAHDPHVAADDVRELGVELTDLETVFRESDFVAVNTLLNDQTRGLVGERELGWMKPTAFLINAARGPIVDEAALVRALEQRRIAGAGLDVFREEPSGADHPLLKLDNVVLSPHGLAWTEETVRNNGLEACDNILAVARGEAPPGLVNREVLGRPGFRAKLARYSEP